MRRWVVAAVVAAVLVAILAAAAARSDETTPQRHRVVTADYLPGVGADLFLPAHVQRAPLVVLIPGGGWQTSGRRGLQPLAERLVSRGIVAVTATYQAASDGVRFPVPAADVECAIDFATARTRRAGITPGPVLALGHSAGAHLAMLTALTGQRFRAAHCSYPPARVDGVIGLAGPYNIMSLQTLAQHLFGASPAADPTDWRTANPVTWVRQRPNMPVLLANGTDDTTVSPTFATSFAERLRAAGHPVRLEIVPGANHGSIFQPDVIAHRILAWIHSPIVRSGRA
ncbi:MAG TPA: alpha/beta hydrolase [Jatrophihabitans sp.]|nr:alpha/beta hydrolase [Jatrophihabitans sp.]